MKILDRYIARQLLGVTALGVMALSALLLLGNLFKELRPLLVENKAPISIVLEFIFQVIPFSLMFSIPWGFLTAVLLVYGRLASDNELTSMRMSGMSLWRLSTPAIAIGIALSGLCYWINIDIAPRAKQSISELLIKAASINPKGLLNEGQAITKFDNLEIYIDKRVDDVIHGMHIYQKADEKSPSVAMHSERVTMDFSPEKKNPHPESHQSPHHHAGRRLHLPKRDHGRDASEHQPGQIPLPAHQGQPLHQPGNPGSSGHARLSG